MFILNNQHLGMVVQWEDRFYKANRAHTYLGNRVCCCCTPSVVSARLITLPLDARSVLLLQLQGIKQGVVGAGGRLPEVRPDKGHLPRLCDDGPVLWGPRQASYQAGGAQASHPVRRLLPSPCLMWIESFRLALSCPSRMFVQFDSDQQRRWVQGDAGDSRPLLAGCHGAPRGTCAAHDPRRCLIQGNYHQRRRNCGVLECQSAAQL